eukprot:Gb_22079 [translate_table: standard]
METPKSPLSATPACYVRRTDEDLFHWEFPYWRNKVVYVPERVSVPYIIAESPFIQVSHFVQSLPPSLHSFLFTHSPSLRVPVPSRNRCLKSEGSRLRGESPDLLLNTDSRQAWTIGEPTSDLHLFPASTSSLSPGENVILIPSIMEWKPWSHL